MSAPIRVQVEADEFPTAEAVRAEQPTGQPTPSDGDVTMETPRIMFPDQLISQHLEDNPGTGQENERASAKPLAVRSLKNPPEIWDLVHETPGHFDPGGAFVARLTSSKTNPILLLMLGVMLISGLSAFAVMTLRDGQKRGGAAAQVQEERGSSQTVPASQASAPASAPESALNAPVNTSPSAEYVVDNTSPQPTALPPTASPQTDPQDDNRASASKALTDNIQPTGVSEAQAHRNGPVVNNISKRTALRAGRAAAWSGNKRVTVASGWQNADKPADQPADKRGPARGASPAAGPDTSAKSQTPQAPQTVDLKERYEKSSSDSASAKKRSNPTLSPQLIAPPTTSSAPKAKVIQWP